MWTAFQKVYVSPPVLNPYNGVTTDLPVLRKSFALSLLI